MHMYIHRAYMHALHACMQACRMVKPAGEPPIKAGLKKTMEVS